MAKKMLSSSREFYMEVQKRNEQAELYKTTEQKKIADLELQLKTSRLHFADQNKKLKEAQKQIKYLQNEVKNLKADNENLKEDMRKSLTDRKR